MLANIKDADLSRASEKKSGLKSEKKGPTGNGPEMGLALMRPAVHQKCVGLTFKSKDRATVRAMS